MSVDSEFHIHGFRIPFWILDAISWIPDSTVQNSLDSGFRITLCGAIYWLRSSFLKLITFLYVCRVRKLLEPTALQMMPRSSCWAAPHLEERENTNVIVQVLKILESLKCTVRFTIGSADVTIIQDGHPSFSKLRQLLNEGKWFHVIRNRKIPKETICFVIS